MMNAGQGKLLRIYIAETDRHEGRPLYEWIVQKAREENLAGATVLRGMEGFGAHHRIHTAKVLRLAQELPIIIEIIDTDEKIADFLELIDGVLEKGLAAVTDVRFHVYHKPA